MKFCETIIRGAACGALVLAVAACSSAPETPGGMAASSQPMTSAEHLPNSVAWRSPDLDPARYNSFVVTPVKVYNGADAKFGGATDSDKQNLAAFMREEFARVLSERYRVVNTPGPGTARLELTLAGMSENIPVASTAATVLPIGLVTNVARGSQSAMFAGSVTYKGDLYDSQTNKLLVSFVTTKTPSPLNLGATVSSSGAQQAAVTEGAEDVREAIETAHQQAYQQPARR